MYYKIMGEWLEARDARHLVSVWRRGSYQRLRTNAALMKEVASRVRMWNGKRINTKNPEAFVKSLQRAGFIRRIGEFPK
jgi:hypothetical protein